MFHLKCHNKKCLHEWDYKGNKEKGDYTNCPKSKCHWRVKIELDELRKNIPTIVSYHDGDKNKPTIMKNTGI